MSDIKIDKINDKNIGLDKRSSKTTQVLEKKNKLKQEKTFLEVLMQVDFERRLEEEKSKRR